MFLRRWLERFTPKKKFSLDPETRNTLDAFQGLVGFRFQNPDLLRQALTHRSYLGANGSDLKTSNERMEFLGDSVLELVVNEYLYGRYPDLQEGELTKMKSLLVSRSILSNQAQEMDLGRFLFLSDAERDSGGRHRASILADAFEAVIGSIYLDGGLGAAKEFLQKRLLVGADQILGDRKFTNYKSLLQEFVQAEFKTYPRYRISAQSGPDHKKLFTVDVSVRGRKLGEGRGSNKKKAEQSAAKDALESLQIL
jgi:ribonuclease III